MAANKIPVAAGDSKPPSWMRLPQAQIVHAGEETVPPPCYFEGPSHYHGPLPPAAGASAVAAAAAAALPLPLTAVAVAAAGAVAACTAEGGRKCALRLGHGSLVCTSLPLTQ